MSKGLPATILALPLCLFSARPANAAEAGDVTQTDTFGVVAWNHNFTTGKTTSLGTGVLPISEFIGAHYYVTDRIRLGMNLQFTDLYAGDPPPKGDHFLTFALLPQIGWNFYKHLFAAAVFTYAPRSYGQDKLDLGVQAVFGNAFPITDWANMTLAIEIPYNFYAAESIAVTPLLGLSFKL